MAETKKLSLYQKLQKIQSELKAPKNLLNKFGGYKYRNAEGILEALKPYEEKYGVATVITDEIEEVGGRVYVVAIATIYDCDSEQTITVSARAREAESKKGMDEAQITGATSSYARKYALNGLFLLDDTKDADTDEYRNESENRAKTAPKAKATPKPTAPEPPQEEDRRPKIFAELKKFCAENGIDYKKYKLMSNSPVQDFEKAYSMALTEAAENDGGELPFPLDV
jgi:hypothetical protein